MNGDIDEKIGYLLRAIEDQGERIAGCGARREERETKNEAVIASINKKLTTLTVVVAMLAVSQFGSGAVPLAGAIIKAAVASF